LAENIFSSKLDVNDISAMRNPESGSNSQAVDRRPWGSFTILDEGENYKVKRIEVIPGKRLSYQKHSRRSEHWFVVRGIANVTLNGRQILVNAGESLDIPVGTLHRVENAPDAELLIFIETQTGDYFGEDDIVRIEDDFGRT
jgi:mannose-6-phosphate isomerase